MAYEDRDFLSTNTDDPSRPAVSRPAHPLPEHREKNIDYDRYLQVSKDRFQIFSAQERRQRHHSAVTTILVVALFIVLIVWAIASRSA